MSDSYGDLALSLANLVIKILGSMNCFHDNPFDNVSEIEKSLIIIEYIQTDRHKLHITS